MTNSFDPFSALIGTVIDSTELNSTTKAVQKKCTPSISKCLQELRDVIRQGEERTKFNPDRISSCLPRELRSFFEARAKGFSDNDVSKKILEIVRDEIYGRIPNYTAEAKKEEAAGFTLGIKLTAVFMDVNVANVQMNAAVKGLDYELFKVTALKEFGSSACSLPDNKFPIEDVTEAVIGTRKRGRNRQLVACLLNMAEDMKSNPTRNFEHE